MDDPWKSCDKPCRFLFERIYESKITGIPAGIENKCDHPLYRDMHVVLSINLSAQNLTEKLLQFAHGINEEGNCVDPMHMDEIVPNATVKRLANEILRLLTNQTQKIHAALKDAPQIERERFYTKTNDEAAKEHLSHQLGQFANGEQGSQLMDWLLHGGEDDSR